MKRFACIIVKILPLLILLGCGGCFSVQPVARDYMTEDDYQLCLAQVTLDFLENPWVLSAMTDGKRPGKLILNPSHHNGTMRIRTGRGNGALRSFNLDREFTRPLLRMLQDAVACGEFWEELRSKHPSVWHELCVKNGKDETTWRPLALAHPLFTEVVNLPDGSCTHSMSVIFSQNTDRIDASHSVEHFRFFIRVLEIESGIEVVSAKGSAQHEWKRKIW